MKIKAPSGSRILFEEEDMFLTEYCDDNDIWFWKIIGENPFLIERGFKEQGGLYTLSFPQRAKMFSQIQVVLMLGYLKQMKDESFEVE